jgi:hypothetical protein
MGEQAFPGTRGILGIWLQIFHHASFGRILD